jgi:hypothetical protein
MNKKNLSDYKRKYNTFRHHAWAGLGFLSVLLVVRIIIPTLSEIILPILGIIVIYVVVSLIFTYKYRTGLYTEDNIIKVKPSYEIEKENIRDEIEKAKLKIEKKKIKSKVKELKKRNKKS